MISRKQAAGIALDHAVSQGLGVRVERVVRLHGIEGRRPTPYLGFGEVLEDACWIAYIDDERSPDRLCSSTIVAIDPATGRVVYSGSAGDEG